MSLIQHRSIQGSTPVLVPHAEKAPALAPRLRSAVAYIVTVGALLAVIAVPITFPGGAKQAAYPPGYAPHGGFAGPVLPEYPPGYAPHGGFAGTVWTYPPGYAPHGGFAGTVWTYPPGYAPHGGFAGTSLALNEG